MGLIGWPPRPKPQSKCQGQHVHPSKEYIYQVIAVQQRVAARDYGESAPSTIEFSNIHLVNANWECNVENTERERKGKQGHTSAAIIINKWSGQGCSHRCAKRWHPINSHAECRAGTDVINAVQGVGHKKLCSGRHHPHEVRA